MTLAIALVTREYALLATDRRITKTLDGLRLGHADSDTKTAILDGRYLMGFAGLGRFPSSDIDAVTGEPKRQRMESWLADLLAGVDSARYIDTIATAIGDACESYGFDKPHKFICAGYRQEGDDLIPVAFTIENRRAVPYSFYSRKEDLTGDALLLHAGAEPDPDTYERLRRVVERNAGAYALRPEIFTPHLNRVFAATAASDEDETVGDTVLLTTLPRMAVPVQHPEAFMDNTQAYAMSDFYYYDHHDSVTGVSLSEQYGPAIIGPTMTSHSLKLIRGEGDEIGPIEGS